MWQRKRGSRPSLRDARGLLNSGCRTRGIFTAFADFYPRVNKGDSSENDSGFERWQNYPLFFEQFIKLVCHGLPQQRFVFCGGGQKLLFRFTSRDTRFFQVAEFKRGGFASFTARTPAMGDFHGADNQKSLFSVSRDSCRVTAKHPTESSTQLGVWCWPVFHSYSIAVSRGHLKCLEGTWEGGGGCPVFSTPPPRHDKGPGAPLRP